MNFEDSMRLRLNFEVEIQIISSCSAGLFGCCSKICIASRAAYWNGFVVESKLQESLQPGFEG